MAALEKENGFFNGGVTCYVNATLQSLFHVPAFVEWMKSGYAHHRSYCTSDITTDNVICSVCATYLTLRHYEQNDTPIYPSRIINLLPAIMDPMRFKPEEQQDAHEFLGVLLFSLAECWSTSDEGFLNPIHSIFGLVTINKKTCPSCFLHSSETQPETDLSIHLANDVAEINIVQGLQRCFGYQTIEDRFCPYCQEVGESTQTLRISKFPKVLMIHINLFGNDNQRIRTQTVFSENLNMEQFADETLLGTDTVFDYKLVASISHHGYYVNVGHYSAKGKGLDGAYRIFDDQVVAAMPNWNCMEKDAYVLFFEQLDRPSAAMDKNVLHHVNHQSSPISLNFDLNQTQEEFLQDMGMCNFNDGGDKNGDSQNLDNSSSLDSQELKQEIKEEPACPLEDIGWIYPDEIDVEAEFAENMTAFLHNEQFKDLCDEDELTMDDTEETENSSATGGGRKRPTRMLSSNLPPGTMIYGVDENGNVERRLITKEDDGNIRVIWILAVVNARNWILGYLVGFTRYLDVKEACLAILKANKCGFTYKIGQNMEETVYLKSGLTLSTQLYVTSLACTLKNIVRELINAKFCVFKKPDTKNQFQDFVKDIKTSIVDTIRELLLRPHDGTENTVIVNGQETSEYLKTLFEKSDKRNKKKNKQPYVVVTHKEVSKKQRRSVDSNPDITSSTDETGKRQHACNLCSKIFKRRWDVVRHIQRMHEKVSKKQRRSVDPNPNTTSNTDATGKRQHTCNFCSKIFSRRWGVVRHIERMHNSESNSTPKRSVTENGSANDHNQAAQPDKPLKVKCSKCPKQFAYQSGMKQHLLTHQHERPMKCPICSRSFKDALDVRQHIRRVHYGRARYTLTRKVLGNFQCHLCGQCFNYENDRREHIKTVHVNAVCKFVCEICGKGFATYPPYKLHMVLHQTEKPDDLSESTPALTEKVPHKSMDVREVELVSSNQMQSQEPPNTVVDCSNQMQQVTTANVLETHEEPQYNCRLSDDRDEREFQCWTCKTTFSLWPEYLAHHKSSHPEKPFTCTICGNEFLYQAGMTRHLKNVHKVCLEVTTHTNDNRIICPICPRRYKDVHSVERHIKINHYGHYAFHTAIKCPNCTLRFSSQMEMEEHKSSHPVYPFPCPVCGKGLATHGSLVSHMDAMHNPDRRFKCSSCDKGFASSVALIRHEIRMHGQDKLP